MTVMDELKLRHLKEEVVYLRKALAMWTDPPEYVKKIIRDADMCRNEIKKIESGKVK